MSTGFNHIQHLTLPSSVLAGFHGAARQLHPAEQQGEQVHKTTAEFSSRNVGNKIHPASPLAGGKTSFLSGQRQIQNAKKQHLLSAGLQRCGLRRPEREKGTQSDFT